MDTATAATLLVLKIYLLAIVISMAVAVLIRVIELVTSAAGGAARRARHSRHDAGESSREAEEDIAAIAAAVHAVLGMHRIVHIEERARGQAWTVAGRSAHHGSHNLSRRAQRKR